MTTAHKLVIERIKKATTLVSAWLTLNFTFRDEKTFFVPSPGKKTPQEIKE